MTQRNRGFTYIGILIAVAVMGALLAEVAVFWHKVEQREKENELLRIGDEFRRAIGAYYLASPGQREYPKTLEDLLLDGRFPFVRRYLRKIYVDPMTGSPEWGIVRGPGDTVAGVYSLSKDAPLKEANFAAEDAAFSGRKQYGEWRFAYAASAPVAVAAAIEGTPPPTPQLPPAYAPPAVAPPQGGSPENRGKYLCDMMHANDIVICGTMLQKFGSDKGQYCLATAAARYDECRNGSPMQALGVFYQ